jgi:hypothetical protein
MPQLSARAGEQGRGFAVVRTRCASWLKIGAIRQPDRQITITLGE